MLRAGAYDQLKQNATKARIPFYGSYTEVKTKFTAKYLVHLSIYDPSVVKKYSFKINVQPLVSIRLILL